MVQEREELGSEKNHNLSISLSYNCTTEIKEDVMGLRWFVKIMPKHAMIHSLTKQVLTLILKYIGSKKT